MADELVLHNYTAASAIAAGQFVALDSSQSVTQPAAVAADTTNTNIIGISIKDVAEGEVITYKPFKTGAIYQVKAGAAISAGDQLGVNSSGLAVTAGSGNVAVPMIAINAASASGDFILGAFVHVGEVGA